MKKKARAIFLNRLADLRSVGASSVTLAAADARFLDGLTVERDGITYYNDIEVRIIDQPKPAKIAK